MIHELKSWEGPFGAMLEGHKRAEFRRDDRGFCIGDVLWLREFDYGRGRYTDRSLLMVVTHVQGGPDFGIPRSHVVLSVKPLHEPGASAYLDDSDLPALDQLLRRLAGTEHSVELVMASKACALALDRLR